MFLSGSGKTTLLRALAAKTGGLKVTHWHFILLRGLSISPVYRQGLPEAANALLYRRGVAYSVLLLAIGNSFFLGNLLESNIRKVLSNGVRALPGSGVGLGFGSGHSLAQADIQTQGCNHFRQAVHRIVGVIVLRQAFMQL